MQTDRTTFNITGGQDVYGADGDKVGSVSGIKGDCVVVSKGFFFPTDYYIPVSAINTVDEDGVYLNVTKDEALHQGWDTAPEVTTTSTSITVFADEPIVDPGLHLDNPVPDSTSYEADQFASGEELRDSDVVTADASTSRVDGTDTMRVELPRRN